MYLKLKTVRLFVPALILVALAAQAQSGPPAAPTSCQAGPGPFNGIAVSWKDNSDNEDGFTVESWHHASGGWHLTATVSVGANSTEAIMSALPGDNRFRVKAFNGAGN